MKEITYKTTDKELIDIANSDEFKDNKLISALANRLRWAVLPHDLDDGRDELFAEKCEDYVNSFTSDYKKVAKYLTHRTHRTLQQNFFKLVMTYINAFAELDDNMTDDRNKASHKLAKEIIRLLKENDINMGLPLI